MRYVIAFCGLLGSLWLSYATSQYIRTVDVPPSDELLLLVILVVMLLPWLPLIARPMRSRPRLLAQLTAIVTILSFLSFLLGALASVGFGVEANPEKNPLPLIIGIAAPAAVLWAFFSNRRWAQERQVQAQLDAANRQMGQAADDNPIHVR